MIKVVQQISAIVSDDANGGAEVPCLLSDLAVDFDTLNTDLAGYDPSSATSPSAAVCRKYARAIFDAYLATSAQGD